MRVKYFSPWAIILLFFSTTALSHADNSIGFAKKLIGEAQIIRQGEPIAVQNGIAVFMNDIIKTNQTGSLGVTFLDNTIISIGPNSEFIIDEYIYQPKDKKLSFISKISKGTLLFISGTISKLAPGSVKVNTPDGTIGIRGTKFLVKSEEADREAVKEWKIQKNKGKVEGKNKGWKIQKRQTQ